MKIWVKSSESGGYVISEKEFIGATTYELLGDTMDEVEQLIPALLSQIKGESNG